MAQAKQELLALEPDEVLDTKGKVCPYPAVLTKLTLERLKPGQVLEVITDNKTSAEESIPAVIEKIPCDYAVVQEGPELWRLKIRKK
jgi:tRNA 2-thiouridine synthesizing protein A